MSSKDPKFGPITASGEIIGLRLLMEDHLISVLRENLTLPSYQKAQRLIYHHTSVQQDLFEIFYQPTWSFLYWFNANVTDNAIKAHSLGLFLHLWEDHLADQQLVSGNLQQRIQEILWNQFQISCTDLTFETPQINANLIAKHLQQYKTSITSRSHPPTLEAYIQRFQQQISIWTFVPYVIGMRHGGTSTGNDLMKIVELFSNAWRLIDDLQDYDEDNAQGNKTALYYFFDTKTRTSWNDPHNKATQERLMLSEHIKILVEHLALDYLLEAEEIAVRNSWHGISSELRQAKAICRPSN